MNPYQSPSSSDSTTYDWSRRKRFALAVSGILMIVLLIATSALWYHYRSYGRLSGKSSAEQFIDFFTDWR